ncbi:hypothetical protein M758_4G265700 [Ceratodon purpureus]|nr:hypothetical protein M758_4G265700 [Ceratodon purpureus]
MVASVPHYKYYPRSVSWQVASVLNPSLQNSLPTSLLSAHSREKREREGGVDADQTELKPEGKAQSPHTAYKSWQEEEEESGHKLTLPPQYVSPGELSKAMPKYIRLKVRPETNGNGKPVPFSTSTEPVKPGNSPGLSPHYDLAAGSPRSQESSGRETPRSVLDFPQNTSTTSKPPQPAAKAASGAASPASPARSLLHTPPPITTKASCETTPPVSAGYQNTPLSSAELRRQKTNPSGALSPRIRSAATSPMPPIPTLGSKVTDAAPASATLLRSKLNTLAQYPELMPRVVQMESTAQGSPLSPAIPVDASRPVRNRLPTPPVALPPTPPIGSRPGSRLRRVRNPHPPEPTLETYKKASPNTHATNTVWNDRRDTSREQTNPRQSILIKST